MAEKKQADEADTTPEPRATPAGPGKPTEGVAVTQMGATFAERSGKKAPAATKKPNSTFADRAKAVKSADTEDKSVSGSKAQKKS